MNKKKYFYNFHLFININYISFSHQIERIDILYSFCEVCANHSLFIERKNRRSYRSCDIVKS